MAINHYIYAMNHYLILHYGFQKPTPEDMDAWNNWFESITDIQVDRGGLRAGRKIMQSGTEDPSFGKDFLTGYTIITSNTLDEAEKMLKVALS